MKKLLLLIFVMMMSVGVANVLAANTATVSQTGDDHVATITQEDENNTHDASITQMGGDENTAEIEQTQDAWGAGANATIEQTGNLNEAYSWNLSGYHAYDDAVITQTGDDNYAEQLFTTGNAWNGTDGTILQTGNYNTSYQTFGDLGTDYSSKLDATQLGDNNWAEQTSGRNGNDGDVYQEGDYNEAYQDLGGRTNIADTSQNGDMNYAEINQSGNSNSAYQTQTGDSHSSIINQTGDFNTATVNQ